MSKQFIWLLETKENKYKHTNYFDYSTQKQNPSESTNHKVVVWNLEIRVKEENKIKWE